MIFFSCVQCGMKYKVKDQFGGRTTKCATCKNPIVVPRPDRTQDFAPTAGIAGAQSSLDKAGLKSELTLSGKPGAESPVSDLLGGANQNVGRYVIDKEIARGGMGAVLRGIDRDIRREVAIKFMLNVHNAKQKVRFIEEAQITGQLEHPNIVPVHELGVDDQERLYFSMKMVKGRSLAEILEALAQEPGAEKEWPLSRLLTILVNVCHALDYAHSRFVIHRDIKPANIMVGDFGEVYVMDWGLAKVVGGTSEPESKRSTPPTSGSSPGLAPSPIATNREDDSELTQDGAIMGTPAYMPPEQALGQVHAIDQRSDIYSLGAILYALLTLEPPIEKKGDSLSVLMRVAEGKIRKPEDRAPDRFKHGQIPLELSAIVMKALSKEPRHRYQNVADLRRDLELFMAGRSVSAKRDTFREVAWKFIKRNKGISAGLSLALLVLLVSLVFLFSAWNEARSASAEKDARTRKAVPALIDAARQAIQQQQLDNALAHLQVALDYAPDETAARLLKAQVLVSRKEFSAAAADLQRYLHLRPDDEAAAKLNQLLTSGNTELPHVQSDLGNLLVQQKQPGLAVGLFIGNEKRLEVYRQQIDKAWPGVGKALILDKDFKFTLHLSHAKESFVDLAPLRGIPLSKFRLSNKNTRDLSPLQGMPLTTLELYSLPNLKDLKPLQGLPLNTLTIFQCPEIEDLSPLKNMPLTSLLIEKCPFITDLSGLDGLPLAKFHYLPGVKAPLAELGPLQGAPIKELKITYCSVKSLAPLEKMPLRILDLSFNPKVKDLTPLQGLPLEDLTLMNTDVLDLTPLQGMPLTTLRLQATPVKDLTPLAGLPLTSLYLFATKVRDVTPLDGLPLEFIQLPTPVKTIKGLEVLQRQESLRRIAYGPSQTGQPSEEFWTKLKDGEIK